VLGRAALGLLLVACAATARAGGGLEVTSTATVAAETTVVVDVRNAGEGDVSDVTPVVLFQGQERRGDPRSTLAPGAQATWTFALPHPVEPGTVPAVVDVRYADARGRHGVPAIAPVSTPGLLPEPEVEATLTAVPMTGYARAQLLLSNPAAVAVHGRVIVVLPAGLSTEPVSQAAEVPASGRRIVPLVLQHDGVAPEAGVPMFALFEYDTEGRRHLVVASTGVPGDGGQPAVRPVVVGTAALAAALALCGVAWWRAAAKRHRG